MGVDGGAGIDLDLELGPIELEAAIHLDRAAARRHAELIDKLARPHARFQLLIGGAATGAGNKPLVIDLDRPPTGVIWIPQFVEVFGPDPFGANIANVTAAVFAGPLPSMGGLTLGPPVQGLDYSGCRITSMPVPNTVNFPDKSPVFPNERLYGIITGTGLVAGGAQYHMLVGVLQVPQSDEALTW